MTDIVGKLKTLLPDGAVIEGEAISSRATSYWDSSPMQGKVLVRPSSTDEVSQVLKLCHEHKQPVVVQGGLTGVVEGTLSTPDDVIISVEKMDAVESVDEMDGVAVIEAGAILQDVQEQLANKNLLFPLDLGARGSCTIGGAVATNAGGINVLRYGMMRNLVLGLEAVLADGTVVSSMNQMLKNNTGYDIKQLFIGSEGTLGVVTRAVVKLFPMPMSRQTAMFATESFDAVIRILKGMQGGLAGTLSAYEVMWNNYYCAVTVDGLHDAPMSRDYPYYVIAEAEGADPDADEERFLNLLHAGMESDDIVDAVLPKSEAERDALWQVREEFEPALPAYLYDVSLPMRHMETYAERLKAGLEEWRDDADGLVFGHIADGNLHIFVRPHEEGGNKERSDSIVYGCLDGLDGSVSAEHGIGIEKKEWLPQSRTAEEIELMRGMKRLLDPENLLNPGKIIG
jgi:FAD/FMN-containing dehydrogenase